ncbi:aminomethyltransferase, mitochondrial-like [Liolophura sinensis]|uniref:aminomethyltransferase, mitochondrial-like n=1 Tax=Liolophura sinensis TaxID=3198878 RepID=UPI00315918BB
MWRAKQFAQLLHKITENQYNVVRNMGKQKEPLKVTNLYDLHISHGGKMVPFAGWSMPLQYDDSIPVSHNHVRQKVGLFDVSHMQQCRIHGKDRVKFMESLVVADVDGLSDGQGTLSVFTNEKGGIIDDLIVTKTGDKYLYVVSNAGCAHKVLPHMMSRAKEFKDIGLDVVVEPVDNGLLALQGPDMTKVLQPGLSVDLNRLPFMTSIVTSLFGIPECRVTRCGYTGEDGVEISVEANRATELAEKLLESQDADVRLTGLGPRDSLRLEAGLCLYGNDIDETTTPVEAALTWTIGKRRREYAANFPGAEIILDQLKNKPRRRRVGFLSSGSPARGGSLVYSESEDQIGIITSGCPSPTLKKNIAMGYISLEKAKVGTKVKLEVRKKMVDAVVSKMPFVPSKYFILK